MDPRFPAFTTLENLRNKGHRLSLWLSQVIKSRRKEDQEEPCRHSEEEAKEIIGGKCDDREKETTGT